MKKLLVAVAALGMLAAFSFTSCKENKDCKCSGSALGMSTGSYTVTRDSLEAMGLSKCSDMNVDLGMLGSVKCK